MKDSFKQTVVMTEEIEAIFQSSAAEDKLTTFVVDVYRNIATLNGRGTFYETSVIAVMTNKNDTCQEEPPEKEIDHLKKKSI